MRAYILVEVDPGKEKEYIKKLESLHKECKCIKQMDLVHGSFDVVVCLEEEIKALDGMILTIRSLPNVRRTETLLAFEHLPIPESVG